MATGSVFGLVQRDAYVMVLITYVSLVLVPLVVYLFSAFADTAGLKEPSDQVGLWTEAHRWWTYGILVLAGVTILSISARISQRLYATREF